MMFSIGLLRQLEGLEPDLKNVLWMVLEEIEHHRETSVTKTEFNELKAIVRDISVSVRELGVAQARTEQRMEELTQAQARTEQEIAKLSHGLNATRGQLGGLSKSVSYALENEAFRKLPAYLKTHHQLEITQRFVRQFIGGEEINLFAKATRQGQEVLIVGESVLKLDDKSKLRKLENHVKGVRQVFSQPIVPLLITHVVHPAVLELAQAQGIVVVQSFEWD
jgi:hypothetical protein